jgi:hypothetical protein
MRRILIAFLISPGALPLLFVLVDAGIGRTTGLWMLGLAMLPSTYFVAAAFGAPALWLFRRMHWRRPWQFAIAGALFGWALLLLGSPSLVRVGSLLAFYGGLGGMSAWTFWLIGVRGNPWFLRSPAPPALDPIVDRRVSGQVQP